MRCRECECHRVPPSAVRLAWRARGAVRRVVTCHEGPHLWQEKVVEAALLGEFAKVFDDRRGRALQGISRQRTSVTTATTTCKSGWPGQHPGCRTGCPPRQARRGLSAHEPRAPRPPLATPPRDPRRDAGPWDGEHASTTRGLARTLTGWSTVFNSSACCALYVLVAGMMSWGRGGAGSKQQQRCMSMPAKPAPWRGRGRRHTRKY